MTYQKNITYIKKSIIYLLIASMLFNTGISGLTSIMDVNRTTRRNMVKVNRESKTNRDSQIQAVADNLNSDRSKMESATGNGNSSPKKKGTPPKKTGGAALPISSTQYQILVRIIHAEAGGEPLKGQVAVAAVLLNRIRSGRFPKSISANVFRNGEFESVSNGYIWSEPTSSAYKAAKLALQGWDPTYGALYFYNPAKTYTNWIWSRPIHTRIGNHNFAG
jgi:spore germination cell wall hydrolase CwlJ-like protein